MDIEGEKENILEAQYDKADALIYAFNKSIRSLNDSLESQNYSNNVIKEFISWNENILEMNVNILDGDSLKVFASSDNTSVNTSSNSYVIHGNNYSRLCYEENNTYYIPQHNGEKIHILIVLSPIIRNGETIGSFEIIVSMNDAYEYLDTYTENRVKNIVLNSAVILFILLFGILFLLRKSIVKPIITFRNTANVIGKGDLDTRVNIKSKDELGDLADAFNQMAKDLKESRDKIQEYNKILEGLLEQKDEFIGQLGHDLKNPLQPLVGLLPMLIEQEKDPSIKEALEVMNHNVEYMRELIFKTLQLAKLRSAKIEFDIENVDLHSEAEGVIKSEGILLKEHDVKVENMIDKKTFVMADKLRLAELLKNLIENAVKYMPKKNSKITIDAEQYKNNFVKISVTDTGIGMTKDQIRKIFDEFYKADRFSSEVKSSGLGLAICKRIVEKHGGRIWADSPGPDRGSTIYFTLKKGVEK